MEDKERKKATGKRIKNIRKELGLTMKEFGEKLEPVASDSIVSRWERGVSIPNNERLKQISKLGNRSVVFLLTGEQDWFDKKEYFSGSLAKQAIKDIQQATAKLQYDLKHENIVIGEATFIINALDFLNNSNPDDIILMSSFLRVLNHNKNVLHEPDVDKEEVLADIEETTEEFNKLLKRRYGYEGD